MAGQLKYSMYKILSNLRSVVSLCMGLYQIIKIKSPVN